MSQDHQAGRVGYVAEHQENMEYTTPNWVHDDNFGRTIACGEVSNKTHPEAGWQQKDFINLADIDYGHSGQWAWSVWYKHEVDVNFANYQREQFFGHGSLLALVSAPSVRIAPYSPARLASRRRARLRIPALAAWHGSLA